ncbi:MAG TPA: hypothetical protein VIJ94_06295 [Caulobacteraceae bacterium]
MSDQAADKSPQIQADVRCAPYPLPAAIVVERFVISSTPKAILIRFDSVAPDTVSGELTLVPAFCGMLSPETAQALMNSLGQIAKARLTLSADTTRPQ